MKKIRKNSARQGAINRASGSKDGYLRIGSDKKA